ncbi:MAG TPA: hypothetical protein VMT46_05785 [Anaerolineaceae bacterium]|nr:hypothetical protein [Anaerolineaceae bacterium]
MNNRIGNQNVSPNPVTYQEHRRQAFQQILLPILLCAIILTALGVLAALGSNQQVARWGNISAIFLILPLFVILLIMLAIFGALAFGVTRLLQILPGYSHLAQIYVDHYGKKIQEFSDRLARPVIDVRSWIAGVQTVVKRKP